MTHEEGWNQNFELLKAYIEEHHHLPDKKKVENRGLLWWAKYQRKHIKAGALDEEKTRLFLELMGSRSREHTGGKRKLTIKHFTNTQTPHIYRFRLHRPCRPDAGTLRQPETGGCPCTISEDGICREYNTSQKNYVEM